MKHKGLAILLCLAMVLTMILPGTLAVSADETAGDSQTVECTCGTEDDTHAEDCPLYIQPEPSEEEPICICGAEDDTHAEDCPLYDADDDSDTAETTAPTEDEQIEFSPAPAIAVDDGTVVDSEVARDAVSFTNVAPLMTGTSDYGISMASSMFNTYSAAPFALTREGDSTVANGLELSKSATYDEETGKYTITLEAYVTGQTVTTTTTTETPADIVLVLDLSSSMKEYMKTYSYSIYSGTNTQNKNLYANRHNGGKSNLWYQVEDNYYSVSVNAQLNYTKLSTSGWKNYTTEAYGYNSPLSSSCWYYYANNLYVKIGDSYNKVTVTRSENWQNRTYTYTYTDANGNTVTVTSPGNNSSPKFAENLEFYTPSAEDANTVYTYTYTVNGETTTICTSTGSSNQVSGYTFYSRQTTTGSTTRLAALKTAVNSFIDSVCAKAAGEDNTIGTEDDINHRIAIVGFNTSATAYTKSGNSLTFLDMNSSNVNITLKSTVDKLSTATGTVPNNGINMANDLFKSDTTTGHSRVVILFTDGYPSTSGSSNFTDSYANDTISVTHTSKSTYGATVYTVAVLDDADPTADISSSTTLTGNTLKVNQYLHYASSNYPDATSLTSSGSLNSNADPFNGGKSYYLTAADGQSLANIFTGIASEIEAGGAANSTLDSSTVVKDIIAPSFTVPANTSDVKIYTANCTGAGLTFGNRTTATGVTATIEGDTLNVTGFNFSENWCGSHSGTYSGKKLIIEFNVSPKEGFLGGNNVPTNGDKSGIYDKDGNNIGCFEVPNVNVPIADITITATDKNVYLTQVPTEEQLKSGVTIKCGNVDISDLSKLDDWQKAYVNLESSFTCSEGFNATTDSTYTVTATVSPKAEGDSTKPGTVATAKTGTEKKNINVFKPELTYKDSEVYYGDNAPTSFAGNLTKTEWKHEETLSTTVTMTGTAPTLDLTCTPDSSKISNGKINSKQDIAVGVTVKIGTTDVTEKTTFVHTKCDGTCTDPTNGKFWLHVKTCQLTITKAAGANTTIGDDEYFVFTIKKDGEVYTQVTIQGTGSVTISELPVGTYTVEEDAATAWRYTSQTITGNGNLSSTNPTGSFTCTNANKNDKWLNHFARVINTFDKTNEKNETEG